MIKSKKQTSYKLGKISCQKFWKKTGSPVFLGQTRVFLKSPGMFLLGGGEPPCREGLDLRSSKKRQDRVGFNRKNQTR